jgi:hypothetical protein
MRGETCVVCAETMPPIESVKNAIGKAVPDTIYRKLAAWNAERKRLGCNVKAAHMGAGTNTYGPTYGFTSL